MLDIPSNLASPLKALLGSVAVAFVFLFKHIISVKDFFYPPLVLFLAGHPLDP